MGHKSLNFTFEGESFREFVRFLQENFYGLFAFAAPKDAMPPILQRKLSQIATKPRNSQKFSPLKVSRYTVLNSSLASHSITHSILTVASHTPLGEKTAWSTVVKTRGLSSGRET